jgi:Uma2 family endonuclease
LVPKEKLGRVYSELLYDFCGNVHAPDVSFFVAKKDPLLNRRKRVQRFVPDLAIEIASQSDAYEGLLQKVQRYLDSGTQEVWLISVETRYITIFPRNQVLRGSDELSTPLIPGFSITVERLFVEADYEITTTS